MYEDKVLTCRECRGKFVFTVEEQEFYAQKGLPGPPKRCKDCRRAGRLKQAGRPLHKAVCAACGREARLPFCPRPDRMVYCQDCYAQIAAERQERRGAGPKR